MLPGQTWTRFLRHRLAVAGLVFLILLIVMALFAPWLAPGSPYDIDAEAFQAPPSPRHLLGTDTVGRDVLSRLIYAARVSLSVGLVAVSLYVFIGTLLGAIAGYYGGPVDSIIMRAADVVLSFPYLMLILVIVAMVGPSIYNIMGVLGFLGWPRIARIVRGTFLSLREQTFVEAGRAAGMRDARIIFRHILPNSMAPLLVAATFGIADAILTEAALSFLGLGVQPPTASWGNLLTDAQSLTILEQMPWMWVPPGIMIFLSVLAINFVGDGLRDALDPNLKR
ncbi:MAG TPA: ABC transporter permease [Firmicutes bacterium]|nr:ABC transporter permease [Bacillota bacterium]